MRYEIMSEFLSKIRVGIVSYTKEQSRYLTWVRVTNSRLHTKILLRCLYLRRTITQCDRSSLYHRKLLKPYTRNIFNEK